MEYITYRNKIAAIADGEEVGEVTFPEREKGVSSITLMWRTGLEDRESRRSLCVARWRKLSERGTKWRQRAAMPCCGWREIAAAKSLAH